MTPSGNICTDNLRKPQATDLYTKNSCIFANKGSFMVKSATVSPLSFFFILSNRDFPIRGISSLSSAILIPGESLIKRRREPFILKYLSKSSVFLMNKLKVAL